MGQFYSNPQPKDLKQAIAPLEGFFIRLCIVLSVILPPLVFCAYKLYFYPPDSILEGLGWIGASLVTWISILAGLADFTGHSLRDVWAIENLKAIWVKIIIGLALASLIASFTILALFVFRWYQSNQRALNQEMESNKIQILVAEFSEGANSEIPSDRTITYLLYNKLQNLQLKDSGIEVILLNEVILDRNTAVRITGERDAAAIIWGTYTLSPTHARIDVHLQPSPLIGVYSQDYLEEPKERTADISEWSAFTLHSDVTNELSYLVSFVSGLANYSEGRLDQALIDFDEAISYSVESQALGLESVFYYKGLIFRQQKKYAEAETEFNRAIMKNPNFAPAFNNLGLIYQDQNRIDDAIIQYYKAIESNPQFAGAYNNLALAYGIQGKPVEESISLYSKALQIEPNNFVFHQNLGILYQNQGKYNEALYEYEQAVSNYPYDAYAYFNLASLYRDIGKWKDAIAACQKAIELDPNNASYHNYLGVLYSDTGRDSDDSIAEYKKAVGLNPNVAAYHSNLGLEYEYSGNLEEAQFEYESAIRLESSNPIPLCRLGSLLLKRNQEQGLENLTKCEQIVLNNKNTPSWHNELGMTYLATKDSVKALNEFQTAVALDSEEYGYHGNLASAYEELGQIQEAINEIEITLRTAPDPFIYLLQLSRLKWKSQDYAGSIKPIALAILEAPFALKLTILVGFAFIILEIFAIRMMKNKRRREMLAKLTIDTMVKGVLPTIITVRKLVIRIKLFGADNQIIQSGLSLMQSKLGRFIAILYHTLSNTDLLAGREESAMLLLEESLQVDSSYTPAIYLLVPFYANRGDLIRAYHLANRGLRNSPNDIVMRIVLGDIEFAWGTIDKAVGQWKDAININVDKVIELRFEHLRLDPLHIPAHFTMGLAYKAKGELKKALVGLDITAKSSQNKALKNLAEKEIENLQ